MKMGFLLLGIAGAIAIGVISYQSRGGQGYLLVESPGVELNLRAGWIRTGALSSESGPVRVKAGWYHPLNATVLMENQASGKWWSLRTSDGPWGDLERIQVVQGQTNVLHLGPPFKLHTDVQQAGRTLSIGLSLIGQANEHWPARLFASAGAVEPPTVEITDASGKMLVVGQFQFG